MRFYGRESRLKIRAYIIIIILGFSITAIARAILIY